MTARECIAPLAARLRTALADEKQRVNLLVLMGPGRSCAAGIFRLAAGRRCSAARPQPPCRRRPPTTPPSWKAA